MEEKKPNFKEKLVRVVYQMQLYVSESLLIASVLLAALIFVFFIYVRSQKLPDLAAILPAEDTFAFAVFSIEDYLASADKLPEESPFAASKLQIPFEYYLGSSPEKLDFIDDKIGIAFVSEEPVIFFKIKSKKKALKYLKTLLIPDEELTEENDIYSYPLSHPFSFTFAGNLLAFSTKSEILLEILSDKQKIIDTENYQNLRSRLQYFSSGFFYSNLPKTRLYIAQAFAKIGINEPGFMESLFQIFSSFGGTITMSDSGWNMETFTAVDKSRIENEAFFRYDTKYEQKFLAYLPENFLFEWGGHNVKAQVFRMIDLLNTLHSSAALIFESSIKATALQYLGKGIDLEKEIYPILDGEYLFAMSPDSGVLILELNTEEQEEVFKLRDLFARTYQYENERQVEVEVDGNKVIETQATLVPLTQVEKNYEGHSYVEWKAEDKSFASIAILDDKAIFATNEKDLFDILDKMDGRAEKRSLRDYGQLLSGSDEISILHTELLPDGNILKDLLKGFKNFATTRKVFDDGIFTRHSLQFK